MAPPRLFSCACCQAPIRSARDPLCDRCADALVPSPPLCIRCGSFSCPKIGTCLRPWAELPVIRSFHAGYLSIGRGHEVLTRWKRMQGRWLDARILSVCGGYARETPQASAIVPVPQRALRSLRLGGSPAEKIAQALSIATGIPCSKALELSMDAAQPGGRQARRALFERLASARAYQVPVEARGERGKSVILVDDFMTSGRTIRSAASALAEAGVTSIDVYCLAVRPSYSASAERALPP